MIIYLLQIVPIIAIIFGFSMLLHSHLKYEKWLEQLLDEVINEDKKLNIIRKNFEKIDELSQENLKLKYENTSLQKKTERKKN